MKNECPKYFDLVKDYFMKHFTIFMDEYESDIVNKTLYIQPDKVENILKNHILEINIENALSKRVMFFRYSEGPNAARTISNHITIEIKNTSSNSIYNRMNFFIGDYCDFYNIDLLESSFFVTTGENYSFDKFKKYLDEVKLIIETTNLKDIIKGEIWEEIPINMKPYK